MKLKLQYFGHLMQRANSLKKTLMLGKIEGKWRRGWKRTRWFAEAPILWPLDAKSQLIEKDSDAGKD